MTYDIEPSGESVKLTMTEAHSWDVPEAIYPGGRTGWPKIMSSLKSVLETGRPLVTRSEGPPPEMMEAVKQRARGEAVAEGIVGWVGAKRRNPPSEPAARSAGGLRAFGANLTASHSVLILRSAEGASRRMATERAAILRDGRCAPSSG